MNDREQFEEWYSNGEDNHKALERMSNGEYAYLAAATKWNDWREHSAIKQAELDKANVRIALLEDALREAAEEIGSWGNYADEYFKDKHDLDGCIKKFEDIANNKSSDTWLSDNNKAVEVKVLEEAKGCCLPCCSGGIELMIESRK